MILCQKQNNPGSQICHCSTKWTQLNRKWCQSVFLNSCIDSMIVFSQHLNRVRKKKTEDALQPTATPNGRRTSAERWRWRRGLSVLTDYFTITSFQTLSKALIFPAEHRPERVHNQLIPSVSGGSVSRMCTGCTNKHGCFQDANRGRAAKAKATQRSEPRYEQWKDQSSQEENQEINEKEQRVKVQLKSWSQDRIFVWVYKCAAAALPDRQSALSSVITLSQPAHHSFFSFIKKITFCSEENHNQSIWRLKEMKAGGAPWRAGLWPLRCRLLERPLWCVRQSSVILRLQMCPDHPGCVGS